MAPGPTLEQLIAATESDVKGDNPLELLAEASRTSGEMEQLGDALVGHFVDQCRRAGHTWSEISGALGVSKQAVHKRFSLGEPNFERFTDRARTVLKRAQAEARDRQEAFVGTEHLLLALFTDPESLAAKVLAAAGCTRDQCEAELNAARAIGDPQGEQERIPFTPLASEVLRSAVGQALSMYHNYIGTEHLLLGLFQVTDGLACSILTTVGVSEPDIRQRIQVALNDYMKQRAAAAAAPAGGAAGE
jgi:hypothetical protein